MRGASVVLLALLTRALNPCCRSLSLRDADGQNQQREHPEDRAVDVSKAFTFTARHVLIACRGYFVEKCYSSHIEILSVEKLQSAIRVKVFFSRCPVFWHCEILNKQVLGTQHKLELNQTILGSHKAFNQSSHTCLNHCHVYHLLLKYMNSHSFYLKNGTSESLWTNALLTMSELNAKDHKRGLNCVCFKVHIFLTAEDQVDITDKLCVGTGAWFMPANFIEMYESNLSRLTMFESAVKSAVKSLIGNFPRQTDDWTIPILICVCTKCTVDCKLVQSLHRSVCMISLVKGKGSNHSHRAELYQFICQLEKETDLNQMAQSFFRSDMHTCTDKWKHKEVSPLQWQICTQLFSRGLFHQWIMRVLLITVSLFLIGQTAVVTYMRYTQRYVFTQRVRNLNLSFMLLISWCSLSPLTVAGHSTGCSCKLHHTAFGITFVLCFSCVLGKTLVVLMAFKATMPVSNAMKWFGRLPRRLSVPAFTVTQIFLFVFCFLIYSPSFNLSMNCYQERMTLEYDVLSAICFCASLDHLVLSLILTFLVCNLPFSMACYSELNIHVIMGVTTRISLRALLR